MKREQILALLRAQRPRLAQEFGVKSLSLFGSVARDEATPASDVDVLVEFDRPTGMFGLLRLQQYLEELLHCKVDVGTPGGLRPAFRATVEAEAVHVR